MDLQSVLPFQVLKAYEGRIGCMCGCRGNYWAHPEHREAVAAARGYGVDDDECSLEQVTRVLRLVQAEGPRVDFDDEYAPHFYVEVGGGCLCIYLVPGAADAAA
jgi:hypothetical protein